MMKISATASKDRNTKVCVWGEVSDVITPIKFDVDRFRGIRCLGSKNWGVALTRRVALTNSVITTIMRCGNSF